MGRIKALNNFGIPCSNRTYIIAEVGINHGGDLAVAKKLISSVAKTGADAVKFQTYLTEKRAPAGNQTIYDILKRCELPLDAFAELKDCAEEHGLTFFSTPFDAESLEALESIGCSMYKVASFDVVNQELLRQVARTGKTIVMSVGMANMKEIENAFSLLNRDTRNIALLHCVSSYPLAEEDADLATIYRLQDTFDCPVGYSDHTNDIYVPLSAVAAGAQIIEKHYKIDDDMDCVDAPVSITEKQMTNMVNEIRRLERVFGNGELGVRSAEKDITVFRRPSE